MQVFRTTVCEDDRAKVAFLVGASCSITRGTLITKADEADLAWG